MRRRRSQVLVVIPARLGSTRFPGKVLKVLGGLPIVEWVRCAALAADCGPVVVATDHRDVLRAIELRGGTAVLTPRGCRSGTDRAHAAARIMERVHGRRFATVINVQGDEPFIRPSTIRAVARLAAAGTADIATAVAAITGQADALDPNVVKAVVAADGRCLYFSRARVPYADDGRRLRRRRHIGIYGYSRRALERFTGLRPSALERAERLEQLRALEAGMRITAVAVRERSVGIDTPADLARARRRLGDIRPPSGYKMRGTRNG